MRIKYKLFVKSVFIFIVLFAMDTFAQPSWHWRNPLPQDVTLYAINFADSETGISVGTSGKIVRTIDGGVTWREVESKANEILYSVYFLDNTTGIICGQNGIILRTSDVGITWERINSNTNNTLRKVRFANKNIGWIVGEKGTILKTTDSGKNWFFQASDVKSNLNGLAVLNDSVCLAVGNRRTILRTSNSGEKWEIKYSGDFEPYKLLSVCFKNKDTVYAGGDSHLMFSYDGGCNWVYRGNEIIIKDMVIKNYLFSAGRSENPSEYPYYGGIGIYFLPDFQVCFILRKTPDLYGLTLVNDNILAVGENGTIYRSGEIKYPYIFNDIFCFDEKKIIVCCNDGILLKNDNGNLEWSNKKFYNSPRLEKLVFARNRNQEDIGKCIMLANYFGVQKLLYTENYGDDWRIIGKDLQGITGINFCTNKFGAAVSNSGSIFLTSDGGLNWIESYKLKDVKLNNVFVYDSSFITSVGPQGIILQTKDGGKTWIRRNIDTTSNLKSAWFINTENGFCIGDSATYTGVLLKTTDGGETWNKINKKKHLYFENIYFTNSSNGYIIGGTYLSTTDGGMTWNEDYKISGKAIHFANKNIGAIIHPHGFILQTYNGGLFVNKINEIPGSFNLSQNYPNPFNPSTVISFQVSANYNSQVQLKVYDILGREVKTLVDEYKPAGEHKVTFDAKGLSGGVYFYRLSAGGKIITRKMILIR